MEESFGRRLQVARKAAGYRSQADLAHVLGVSDKSVRNWETGKIPPERIDPASRANLRRFLGNFDAAGDPVEVAIQKSELTRDRATTVIGFYQTKLREQREAQGRQEDVS